MKNKIVAGVLVLLVLFICGNIFVVSISAKTWLVGDNLSDFPNGNFINGVKNITSREITANKEAEQFKFVSVTLIVKDINGNAIKNAEVKAFSEDWSIKYPHDWGRFNYTNESGYTSFEIPVGNWTFFVGGGNEFKWSHTGEGYFTILNDDISPE